MKTLKNIALGFLILLVLYVLGLFLLPEYVRSFGNAIGLKSFNDAVLQSKSDLDAVATENYFEEIKESYDSTMNSAIETKNTIQNGIQTTKEGIDSIRTTVETTKETIDETTKKVNEAKETIEQTGNSIRDFSENINSLTH